MGVVEDDTSPPQTALPPPVPGFSDGGIPMVVEALETSAGAVAKREDLEAELRWVKDSIRARIRVSE